MQGDVRDGLYEQMYQRDVANDQAGRVTSFPATAARQARPTTPEQRAAQRERWRNNPQSSRGAGGTDASALGPSARS